MMLWQDDQDRGEKDSLARLDSVKLALVASKTQTMAQMFPEYVPGEDQSGETQSDIDPNEARRIEDLLESGGVLRFTDIPGGEK